jgi:ribose 5-phosphate isomerase B
VIAIGADHRGYEHKELIKEFLASENYEVKDFGTNSSESVDYPDYAKKVAASVSSGESEFGILICSNGIGVSIAANKVNGIRAANVFSENMAEMSRKHNNANVICFGGETVDINTVKKCLKIFLNTESEGGRHKRRVEKIKDLEGRL